MQEISFQWALVLQDGLVERLILRELLDDAVNDLRLIGNLHQCVPPLVGEPGGGRVLHPLKTLDQIWWPRNQQLILLPRDLSFKLGEFAGQQERKEKLVLLKHRPADVLEYEVSEMTFEVLDADLLFLLDLLLFLLLLNGLHI